MVLEGSAETDPPFGLTTPPAQRPDEMGASMVSAGPLPIILPPQISRIALKPNHCQTTSTTPRGPARGTSGATNARSRDRFEGLVSYKSAFPPPTARAGTVVSDFLQNRPPGHQRSHNRLRAYRESQRRLIRCAAPFTLCAVAHSDAVQRIIYF